MKLVKLLALFSILTFCFSACESENLFLIGSSADDNPDTGGDDGQGNTNTFLGQVAFVKNLGGSRIDEANGIVEAPNGDLLIVGSTNSTDGDITDKTAPDYDILLTRITPEGDLVWAKTYGGSDDDYGQNIITTTDGGFAIVGFNASADGDATTNAGFFDHWLIKLNANGDIEWQKSYGFEGQDQAFTLIQTQDGGYFMGGFLDVDASNGSGNDGVNQTTTPKNNNRHGVGEFWGHKLDAEGNLEFRRYFGGTNNDRCYAVFETSDNGFILFGSSESNDFDNQTNKGSYDFWMVKQNAEKNLEWEQSLGGSEIDMGYGFTATQDGNYVVAGDTRSPDGDISNPLGNADFWVVKTTTTGNIIWENTYGGTQFDAARTLIETQSGKLVVAGSSRSDDGQLTQNNGQNDAWIIILNSDGSLDKSFNLGGNGIDQIYGVVETSEKTLYAIGRTNSTDTFLTNPRGDYDFLIIKIE